MALQEDGFDPTIQTLLDECENDWGMPEENRALILPYGIAPLDRLLYGLDRTYGEVVVIMGPEKNRKTTLFVNIVANYMTDDRVHDKPMTGIDVLESGMPRKKVRDILISNLATRYLLAQGHEHRNFCPLCSQPQCKELGINPKFLRFRTRSKIQKEAIDQAIETMYGWPLHIYDAGPRTGDTRNLEAAKKRWRMMIDHYGTEVLVTDHVQQYSYTDEVNDYEKQKRAVAAVADLVAQEQIVVLMLSQVSLTSIREQRSGSGKLGALGGNKAAAEANTILSTGYEDSSGEMRIKIEDAREAARITIYHPLEDTSGAFYGEARVGGAF